MFGSLFTLTTVIFFTRDKRTQYKSWKWGGCILPYLSENYKDCSSTIYLKTKCQLQNGCSNKQGKTKKTGRRVNAIKFYQLLYSIPHRSLLLSPLELYRFTDKPYIYDLMYNLRVECQFSMHFEGDCDKGYIYTYAFTSRYEI